MPANLKARIAELIQIKSTISETYLHRGEAELIEFMQNTIQRTESESQRLPASKFRVAELNDFFIKTLV